MLQGALNTFSQMDLSVKTQKSFLRECWRSKVFAFLGDLLIWAALASSAASFQIWKCSGSKYILFPAPALCPIGGSMMLCKGPCITKQCQKRGCLRGQRWNDVYVRCADPRDATLVCCFECCSLTGS